MAQHGTAHSAAQHSTQNSAAQRSTAQPSPAQRSTAEDGMAWRRTGHSTACKPAYRTLLSKCYQALQPTRTDTSHDVPANLHPGGGCRHIHPDPMRPLSAGRIAHLLPGPQIPCSKKELGALGGAAFSSGHMEAFRGQQIGFSFHMNAVCSSFNGC